MIILSWNCNGAFRKKFDSLSAFDADLLIIQECENPLESKDLKYLKWAENYLWIGSNRHKGLGIFAKKNLSLKMLDWPNQYKDHTVKYFLPCLINEQFKLLGVWNHSNNSPNFGYIGQFWKYLEVNKSQLGSALILGDFNSNPIWDEWDRWWNHSDVVRELEKIGTESVYHWITKEDAGKEIQPTFFLHRNVVKSYHIDYAFFPVSVMSRINSFEVGTYEEWGLFSDHMPLIIDVEI